MILNPGLEVDGPDGTPQSWHKGGWGTNTATLTYPAEGRNGTDGVSVMLADYVDGDAKWYFDDVAVTAGEQYQYSDFYRSTGQHAIVIQYRLNDNTFQYVQIAVLPASVEWKKFVGTFTVPANVVSLTVFHLLQSNGTLITDDHFLGLFSGSPDSFDQGYVSLTFDDGWGSHYTTAKPILDAAGMKGSFFIVTDEATNADPNNINDEFAYMDYARILELQNAGHEVSAHTRTHTSLITLPVVQANEEILGSKNALTSQGLAPVDTFVYPYGEYNASVIQMVKNAGFIGARSVESGYNTQSTDRYVLKVQNILNTTSVAQIQDWIDTAKANKVWLVLVFHRIVPNPDQYDAMPQTLQGTVNYLQQQGVSVIPMREGVLKIPTN